MKLKFRLIFFFLLFSPFVVFSAEKFSIQHVENLMKGNNGAELKKYLSPYYQKGEEPKNTEVFGYFGGYVSFSRFEKKPGEKSETCHFVLGSKAIKGKMYFNFRLVQEDSCKDLKKDVYQCMDYSAQVIEDTPYPGNAATRFSKKSGFNKKELYIILDPPYDSDYERDMFKVYVRKYKGNLLIKWLSYEDGKLVSTDYGIVNRRITAKSEN